jgi:multicomponent Na+:H+ antiporter subunit F
MATFDYAIAAFLLLNLVGGLIRILLGPTVADRMLAAQLFGTTGVAVLVVLADASGVSAFRDVALIFAVLAAVNAIVFVRGSRERPASGEEAPP